MKSEQVARSVCGDCEFFSAQVQRTIYELVKSLMAKEDNQEKIRIKLVLAWREYTGASGRLKFICGPEKFFGNGMWNNKSLWGWKDGMEPVIKKTAPEPRNRHLEEMKAWREQWERERKA